jgi:hypothetical protein
MASSGGLLAVTSGVPLPYSNCSCRFHVCNVLEPFLLVGGFEVLGMISSSLSIYHFCVHLAFGYSMSCQAVMEADLVKEW